MDKSKSALFEPIACFLLGLTSAIEGIRLIIGSDKHSVYQALGPGGYILLVGLGLMIFSLVCCYLLWIRDPATAVNIPATSRAQKRQMIKIILSLVLYIILIDIVGFGWATVCFFVIIFRIMKVSWGKSIILSIIFSVPLRVVFLNWLNISFPKGVFDLYF